MINALIRFNHRENVTQRLRDPLLLGSATILAASKMFCHGINSQIHDKVFFIIILKIDFCLLLKKKLDHQFVR